MEAKALQTQQFPVWCGGIFVCVSDSMMLPMLMARSKWPEI